MRYHRFKNNIVIVENKRIKTYKLIKLDVRKSQFFELNKEGFTICKSINGTNSIKNIVKGSKEKNLTEEKTIRFIRELDRLGLIEFSHKDEVSSITEILGVEWVINSECNLHCKHCYLQNLRGKFPSLKTEEIIKTVDELKNNNVKVINLIGMEPLLRRDIISIIDYVVNSGFFLSIDTNGTFITNILLREIRNFDNRIAFQISLDGHNSRIHGFIRNSSVHFQKVLRAIKRLKKENFAVIVETMLHRENLKYLKELYLLLKSLGIDKWQLMDIHPISNEKYYKKLLPSPKEMFHAFETLHSLSQKSTVPINFPFKGTFNGKLKGDLNFVCEHDDFGENFTLLPNGSVTWCSRLATKDFIGGNLLSQGFNKSLTMLKRQAIYSLRTEDTDCRNCEYLSYCGAGCRANSIWHGGNIQNKDEIACKYWKFFKNHGFKNNNTSIVGINMKIKGVKAYHL